MKQDSLALTWALSSLGGYGIYGLQIAMQFLRRGGKKFVATHKTGVVILPTLTKARLNPILFAAQQISQKLQENPDELLQLSHPVLYAVGNNCAGFEGQDRIRGTFNVGCAALEHTDFSDAAKEYAKNYDCFIAISRWNEQYLKSLDLAPVHLCHQGIDASLFTPLPSTGLWKDRFLVFSGGKFEFRKGQDIVTAAFKRFHEKHKDALLVTAWSTLLPIDTEPFTLAGHCQTVPEIDAQRGLMAGKWLLEQGLPQGSFIELPYTPNMLMPSILNDCHAALFPNRCEGGTNLVPMESAVCGVPTIVSNNTGQKDLVDLLGFTALTEQRSVKRASQQASTEDWGESSVEECVMALERIYDNYQAEKTKALALAEKVKQWEWGTQNEKLLSIVCD